MSSLCTTWVFEYILDRDEVPEELITYFYNELGNSSNLPYPVQARLMLRILREKSSCVTVGGLSALSILLELTEARHRAKFPTYTRFQALAPPLHIRTEIKTQVVLQVLRDAGTLSVQSLSAAAHTAEDIFPDGPQAFPGDLVRKQQLLENLRNPATSDLLLRQHTVQHVYDMVLDYCTRAAAALGPGFIQAVEMDFSRGTYIPIGPGAPAQPAAEQALPQPVQHPQLRPHPPPQTQQPYPNYPTAALPQTMYQDQVQYRPIPQEAPSVHGTSPRTAAAPDRYDQASAPLFSLPVQRKAEHAQRGRALSPLQQLQGHSQQLRRAGGDDPLPGAIERAAEVAQAYRGGRLLVDAPRGTSSARTVQWDSLPDDFSPLNKPVASMPPKRRDPSPLRAVSPMHSEDEGPMPKRARRKEYRSMRPSVPPNRRRVGKWTDEETNTLIRLTRQVGPGDWKKLKEMEPETFANRSTVDLKDKWRNLARQGLVSLVHHHHQEGGEEDEVEQEQIESPDAGEKQHQAGQGEEGGAAQEGGPTQEAAREGAVQESDEQKDGE